MESYCHHTGIHTRIPDSWNLLGQYNRKSLCQMVPSMATLRCVGKQPFPNLQLLGNPPNMPFDSAIPLLKKDSLTSFSHRTHTQKSMHMRLEQFCVSPQAEDTQGTSIPVKNSPSPAPEFPPPALTPHPHRILLPIFELEEKGIIQ